MNRILVVGSDSITGHAIASQLSTSADVETLWVTERRLSTNGSSSAVDAFNFEANSEFEHVVFCGGAAKSSWDEDFGCFEAEQQWLSQCVEFANRLGAKLVYVSSDAVFNGPWVFHTDEDRSYNNDASAKAILNWEGVASTASDHLIVRCNVLAAGASGFLGNLVDQLQQHRDVCLNARTASTVVSDIDFAKSLVECLKCDMTGYVNIGGGERTNAFAFANQLASQLNSSSRITADTTAAPQEQSLRCERLRHETDANIPLLKETLEQFANVTQDCQPLTAAA